ncbi:MAG: hypothetical protein ACOC32_03110 [Nanoarchaeota archaeon]
MIGRPEWFQRRKYGGWGISPKTWQGWVYIAAVLIPFIVFQSLPYWDDYTRMVVTVGWIGFMLLDVTHIMVALRRDEREQKIEAISERNAAWFMVMVLVTGIVYEIITSALAERFEVNIFMTIALFGGALVKTVSNIVMEKKGV